jgi:DNA-binding MarR family transcriptional regulator
MVSKLAKELKISAGFRSLEQETFLEILHTADYLMGEATELLKNHELSTTSYNVLRILRGAGAKGLACGEIGDRLITRVPDVTRLLDRLEVKGLVARTRQSNDRRVVLARITPKGLRLLARLDEPMELLHQEQFSHMSPQDLGKLCDLLETVRAASVEAASPAEGNGSTPN